MKEAAPYRLLGRYHRQISSGNMNEHSSIFKGGLWTPKSPPPRAYATYSRQVVVFDFWMISKYNYRRPKIKHILWVSSGMQVLSLNFGCSSVRFRGQQVLRKTEGQSENVNLTYACADCDVTGSNILRELTRCAGSRIRRKIWIFLNKIHSGNKSSALR